MNGMDTLAHLRRRDRRMVGPAVARDDDTGDVLGWVGERNADERRAHAGASEIAPERRSRSAGCALDPLRVAVRVAREVEDPVPGRVETGEKRRPRRRCDSGDRRLECPEGSLAREPGQGGHPTLLHELADELVVAAVEAEDEGSHLRRVGPTSSLTRRALWRAQRSGLGTATRAGAQALAAWPARRVRCVRRSVPAGPDRRAASRLPPPLPRRP